MTRQEFKDAYRIAREEGYFMLGAEHPARVARVNYNGYLDHLEYRERCAECFGSRCKPLGVALKLWKIRFDYRGHQEGPCRPDSRSVQRPGFLQLVGRELAIKSWLQWGRVETEMDELAGGLWVFGGDE